MATRIPKQGLLIVPTACILCSYWLNAMMRQAACQPRFHELFMHCLRVVEQNGPWIAHEVKVIEMFECVHGSEHAWVRQGSSRQVSNFLVSNGPSNNSTVQICQRSPLAKQTTIVDLKKELIQIT